MWRIYQKVDKYRTIEWECDRNSKWSRKNLFGGGINICVFVRDSYRWSSRPVHRKPVIALAIAAAAAAVAIECTVQTHCHSRQSTRKRKEDRVKIERKQRCPVTVTGSDLHSFLFLFLFGCVLVALTASADFSTSVHSLCRCVSARGVVEHFSQSNIWEKNYNEKNTRRKFKRRNKIKTLHIETKREHSMWIDKIICWLIFFFWFVSCPSAIFLRPICARKTFNGDQYFIRQTMSKNCVLALCCVFLYTTEFMHQL